MRLFFLSLILLSIIGCTTMTTRSKGSTVYNSDPSQLAARQLEVRVLPVSKHVAYQAAIQSFFSLGYSITHTDENSGIITGSRVSGTEEAKQDAKNKQMLGWVPYVGIATLFMKSKKIVAHSMTMFIKEDGENQSQIRFKMQENGEPVWDTILVDKLWTTTQRAVFVDESVPLEKITKEIKTEKGEEDEKNK